MNTYPCEPIQGESGLKLNKNKSSPPGQGRCPEGAEGFILQQLRKS